jgi:hypothetical protein
MLRKNDPYVSVPLVAIAEREFPRLMRHRTNREDALQVLRLVQWQTGGRNILPVLRRELIQLEIDLGLRIPRDPASEAVCAIA